MEKKMKVDGPGEGRMFDQLIHNLKQLSTDAGELADVLIRNGGKPLSRRQCTVVGMAVDSHIHALVDEARYFATTDNDKDFMSNAHEVVRWMDFKRSKL